MGLGFLRRWTDWLTILVYFLQIHDGPYNLIKNWNYKMLM